MRSEIWQFIQSKLSLLESKVKKYTKYRTSLNILALARCWKPSLSLSHLKFYGFTIKHHTACIYYWVTYIIVFKYIVILIQIALPSFISSSTGTRLRETVSGFQKVHISLYSL